MNFDNFDGIDIVDKISLLRNCKSAERNIMISPYNAIANSTEHGVYTGVIEDIDDESDDAVILSIAIYHQADDIDLPLTGRLVMAVNDTQTRVRSKVIRSMERCKLESKYMYHVFDDFSVDGYEEIQDDLKDYLVEKIL